MDLIRNNRLYEACVRNLHIQSDGTVLISKVWLNEAATRGQRKIYKLKAGTKAWRRWWESR